MNAISPHFGATLMSYRQFRHFRTASRLPHGNRRSRDAEIITTPITCTATNTPIVQNGARIVWADVDPVTGNIDPAEIEALITPRTRAVVMVHWGGNPCDITRISEIGRRHGIKVVEDAAHALGVDL